MKNAKQYLSLVFKLLAEKLSIEFWFDPNKDIHEYIYTIKVT